MGCSSCGGGARALAQQRAMTASAPGEETSEEQQERHRMFATATSHRAHNGFCSKNLAYAVTGGEPPDQFEVVSCGCQPTGVSVRIGHAFVLHAISSGMSFDDTAAALNLSNSGPVDKATALRSAVLHMRLMGFLPSEPTPGWP